MQCLVLCKEALSYIWLIPDSRFSLFFLQCVSYPCPCMHFLNMNCSESTVYLRLGGGGGGAEACLGLEMLHMQFLVQLAGFANSWRCKNPSPPPPNPSPLPAFRWTAWILTENVRRFNSFSNLIQKYVAAFQNGFPQNIFWRLFFVIPCVVICQQDKCHFSYCVLHVRKYCA